MYKPLGILMRDRLLVRLVLQVGRVERASIEGLRQVQKNSTCKGTSVHILEDIVCEMSQSCSR